MELSAQTPSKAESKKLFTLALPKIGCLGVGKVLVTHL